jgi:amidase
MPIAPPTSEDMRRLARELHFELDDEEAAVFSAGTTGLVASLDSFDDVEEHNPLRVDADEAQRRGGAKPEGDANRYGAWAWQVSVKREGNGPLAGKRVVLKDNVSLAGVPLQNGSAVLEGYVPNIDASIVTRLLDAGAEIVGKAVCENFCLSGGSHTSFPEPVRNPHDEAYMSAGSSSGCAVLVATNEADLAVGGDQGGSIRMPASWCGIVGLKPTYGLVPYTGILSLDNTLDHTGPMARTSADAALMLDAVAGRDGLDPRQGETPFELPSFSRELERGMRGLRIGVLQEGFGWPNSDAVVDDCVRAAGDRFARLGATVSKLSVPSHLHGGSLMGTLLLEGVLRQLARDEGLGAGWMGFYDTHFLEFYAEARRKRGQHLPPSVKSLMLMGAWLEGKSFGALGARTQNRRRTLRANYDAALAEVDLLLMPTTPILPALLPAADAPLAVRMAAAGNMTANTAAFDVSGHPAISLPCGSAGALPIGAMLVGRHFDDGSVLRAAHAFEVG